MADDMAGEGVEPSERAYRVLNRELRNQVEELSQREQAARAENQALLSRLERMEALLAQSTLLTAPQVVSPGSDVQLGNVGSGTPAPVATSPSAQASELSLRDQGKDPPAQTTEQVTLAVEPGASQAPATRVGAGGSPSVYATPEAPAMFTNLLFELVQEVKEIKQAGQSAGARLAWSDAPVGSVVATPEKAVPGDPARSDAGQAGVRDPSSSGSEALSLEELVQAKVREVLLMEPGQRGLLLGSGMTQVYTVQAPDLQPKGLDFRGDGSPQEKVTAAELILQMEAYRVAVQDKLPLSDGELMWIASRNFAKGQLAAGWWSTRVSEAVPGKTPFPTWADFKEAFVGRFKRPYEAISLRAKLKDAKCEPGNLPGYISLWRHCLDRLALLGEGMAMGDIILNFTRGLPVFLARRVPLDATSFERVIQRVEEEYARRQNLGVILGQQREGRTRLHNMEVGQEGEEYEESGTELEFGGEYEEDEFEVFALQGSRGRGRGHRGRAGPRGRGGSKGGGGPKRAPLAEQQREWFRLGKCVKCGKDGHHAKDCPDPRPQGNQSG